jgi:hypothetical protein
MTSQTETQRVEDIVDAEAGCRAYRALSATVAKGECEAAFEEFRHSDDADHQAFAELCRQVAEFDLRL